MKIFNNIIAVPPGETIKDELEFLKMSQVEFSKRMGISEKHISHLVNGEVTLTYDMAIKLESVLGIEASFWNNLESKYREVLVRIEEEEKQEKEIEILNKMPVKELIKRGWINKTKDVKKQIRELRSFFKIASLDYFKDVEEKLLVVYNSLKEKKVGEEAILFKKALDKEICEYSMASWIRKAEIEAMEIETKEFSKERLEENIVKMKSLTKDNKKENIEELKDICSESGIALVILPHLPKTYVDGVCKWIGKDKVLVILSNRGKKLDKFWFNFFHEIGHIMKHGKKDIFINADETLGMKVEEEANLYAKNTLISPKDFKSIKDMELTKSNICFMANKLGVHPSIIVGRLQNEKIIDYTFLHELKENINI